MSIAVSIISAIIKSAVKCKVENELSNELIGISVDSVSEKGISKINDFISEGKSKINNILSEEKMRSMNISEDNIAYVIAEIKRLFSEIEITDKIFRQCKYDSLNLCSFLWNEYTENNTSYIECESDIKKSLLAVSETLIGLMRESEGFVKDISIQISNTVDDTRVEIQRISDYLEGNFSKISADNQKIFDILREILEQNQKSKKENNITQDRKFQNNKKQDYIKKWNSRLFLHINNEKRPLTLAYTFIMPLYKIHKKINRLEFNSNETFGRIIGKFIKCDGNLNMLITGVPGIGKTSIVSWIANYYKKDKRILILRFRDWEYEELDNGLLQAICSKFGCNKRDLYNKILILDGLDEIKNLNEKQIIIDVFLDEILDLKNFKCIITSRINYIKTEGFLNVFELLPFNSLKISVYYRMVTGIDLKKGVHLDTELLGIPIIFYIVIMSGNDIEKEDKLVL